MSGRRPLAMENCPPTGENIPLTDYSFLEEAFTPDHENQACSKTSALDCAN